MNDTLQRILAAILLVMFAPLLLLIALLYILFYGGGCLYKVTRLGLDEKPFVLYKFRTMKEAAPVMSKAEQQEWETFGKLRHDTRLLPGIGYLMRHFSLDELPQLWNVIRGEMALIGPRPIIVAEKVMYGKYSKLIHSVKPGLTGLWQVLGRNLLTYQRRVAINVYYVRHRSLKLDLWILYRTIWAVIGGRGAY